MFSYCIQYRLLSIDAIELNRNPIQSGQDCIETGWENVGYLKKTRVEIISDEGKSYPKLS